MDACFLRHLLPASVTKHVQAQKEDGLGLACVLYFVGLSSVRSPSEQH